MNKIQQYLKSPEVVGLAKSTRSLYTTVLGYFEEFTKTRRPTRKEALPAFAKWLEEKKLSGPTIQQYLTCSKIFLKWAGHPIEYTYKISSEERKANKEKQLRRWFTEIEVDMCLVYAFPKYNPENALRYRILVRLMAETGARIRELANIKAEDVDLAEGIVWITESKTVPRPAFFSPQTKEMLESLKQVHLVWEGNIFPSVDRLKQVVNEMLEDLQLKNGKDGRGAHCFRHFLATRLFYEGSVRLEDIATLLGDKAETIRDCYLHPTPSMLRKRVSSAMGWD